MSAIFLTEQDVDSLVQMEDAVRITEDAFQALAQGKAINVPRSRVSSPGIMMHTLTATAEYLSVTGWKIYTTTRTTTNFFVAIYSNLSGQMLAMMEANRLGQLRTGAASGVATKYMARPDATSMGIIGCGTQARCQMEAVCQVRSIKHAQVYCRDEYRRERFAIEMAQLLDIDVEAAGSPEQVVTGKDILITATTSKTPVFKGELLEPGMHLNIVGSNHIRKSEIDRETVSRSSRIICDSKEQCRTEAGDFVESLDAGTLEWDNIDELSEVASETKPGRTSNEEITLFKSVGLSIQDVALAAEIYRVAVNHGLGRPLPF